MGIFDNETLHHLTRSLRVKPGQRLLFTDEQKITYECIIESISKDSLYANIEKEYLNDKFLNFNLFLAQSPLRSDAQDLVIEKATEIGVAGVYPILTDNCSVQKSVIEKKIPRWQKIMVESSKQCERADVPECFELTDIEELIKSKKYERIIAFCERLTENNLKNYLANKPIKSDENILVIIGPEGGFSQREIELFTKYEIPKISLGKLILRAETAVIVALGNMIYEFENN